MLILFKVRYAESPSSQLSNDTPYDLTISIDVLSASHFMSAGNLLTTLQFMLIANGAINSCRWLNAAWYVCSALHSLSISSQLKRSKFQRQWHEYQTTLFLRFTWKISSWKLLLKLIFSGRLPEKMLETQKKDWSGLFRFFPPPPPSGLFPPPPPVEAVAAATSVHIFIHWIRLSRVSRQCTQFTNLKYLSRSWLLAEAS